MSAKSFTSTPDVSQDNYITGHLHCSTPFCFLGSQGMYRILREKGPFNPSSIPLYPSSHENHDGYIVDGSGSSTLDLDSRVTSQTLSSRSLISLSAGTCFQDARKAFNVVSPIFFFFVFLFKKIRSKNWDFPLLSQSTDLLDCYVWLIRNENRLSTHYCDLCKKKKKELL